MEKTIIVSTNNKIVKAIKEYEDIKNKIKIFEEKEAQLKEQLKNLKFEKIMIELPDYQKIISIKQYETKRSVLNEEKLMEGLNISKQDLERYKNVKTIKNIKITIK